MTKNGHTKQDKNKPFLFSTEEGFVLFEALPEYAIEQYSGSCILQVETFL